MIEQGNYKELATSLYCLNDALMRSGADEGAEGTTEAMECAQRYFPLVDVSDGRAVGEVYIRALCIVILWCSKVRVARHCGDQQHLTLRRSRAGRWSAEN